ncbi:FHA domain-containing protein [Rhizobium ruizarguesonis]|uniref:FHA domain-containing protein n=1 Tax=Rhizobium ruizarguesonis TaxID=2081791 RepID=UPI0013DF7BCE|nr:FHA domain-containing protein [Rhizobium ruizarguesonis]NEJ98651.1 FHA domain-containing protein [Rhizobium ruizarguesonis]
MRQVLLWKRIVPILALLASFAASSACAAGDKAVSKQQDGISADLAIVQDHAVLRWRFLRPLDKPIDQITADIDGAPLDTPTVQAYPFPGEQTLVMALVDASGAQRGPAIIKQLAALLIAMQSTPPYVSMAAGTYSRELRLVLPRDGIDKIVHSLVMTEPENVEPDLNGALEKGIASLASLPAARRGLFIFTDGHSPNDLATGSLIEAATKSGVAVTFILGGGNRPVNRSQLDILANGTGGQVVQEQDTGAFLRDPYLLLNSGVVAVFPIPATRRLPWQSDPKITVEFHYGNGRMQLEAVHDLPAADFMQTVQFLYRNNQIVLIAGVAGLAGLLGWLIFMLFGRRARPPSEATAAPQLSSERVVAVLQDVQKGTIYAILNKSVMLGRDGANHIVIGDATVSKFHALLEQGDDGSFSIENKSVVNGTMLNEQAIDRAVLSDGDVITVGSTVLRFKSTPA